MKKNNKKFFLERLYRLNYVKSELLRIVETSYFKNTFNKFNDRLFSNSSNTYRKYITSRTRHRIWCPINKSTKLVNKKYRLSRFSFNYVGNANKIIGLMKRGW